MVKESYSIIANRAGVDDISEKITDWASRCKINKKDLIRIRFYAEDVLLSLSEKYEESKNVTVKFGTRLESYSVSIEYEGEAYNPLAGNEEEADEWTNSVLGGMGQKAVYQRRGNINDLHLIIPRRGLKTEWLMIIALVLAVLFGLLGPVIPDPVRVGITAYVLDFASEIFLRLLSLFSGIMIFFCLVNGICGIGSVADFSKVGRVIIGRYLGLSVLAAAVFTYVGQLFFHLSWGGTVNSGSVPEQIEGILLGIIPSNPIAPFHEGDMLQIIFLAVFLGTVLLILGDRVKSFRTFFTQGSTLITKSVDFVCLLLPFFIFTSLLSLFWDMGFSSLLSFWKPLLVALLLATISPVVKLTYVLVKYRISPFLIMKRVAKSVFICFTTASGLAAFSNIKEDLTKGLGVDEKYVALAYPIGMNMYASNYTVVYLTIVLFLAEQSDTPVSVVWLFMAGFFSMIFAMATPCVSGGALICVGVMLTNLNMPQSGLALAGTLTVLMDFYVTALVHFTQEIEVYIQARIFDKVDRSVLENKKEINNPETK